MPASVKDLIMPYGNVQKINIIWVVAAALINANGEVLVQKRATDRSMAGLWEFPGGKIEPNERPEDALVRELDEELGIIVRPDDLTPLSFASAPLGEKHLLMLLYICQKWLGEPTALDAEALQWSSIDALQNLDMPPADVPLVKALLTHALATPSQS
jgi:8-oxo-dGTP diphosphatase